MADQQDNPIQPPTVGEHDGWEAHSASAVDQPRPEEIVERLTDDPADEQIEQRATKAAREDREEEPQQEKPAAEERKGKSASERNAEIRARIAAETKAYHDARRAREFEQAEVVRLRQERESIQRERVAKPAQPAANKPQWAKYEEDGKSYEEFLDDRAEYDRQQTIALTRQELEQRDKAVAERVRQSRVSAIVEQNAEAHDKRINEAAQKHEDFFEVVEKNLSDIPDNPFLVHVIQHHDQGAEILYHLAQHPDEARVLSTLKMSQSVGDAIGMSDTPAQLLSHFAQHPQELDRLNRMHPAVALVALGELKAQMGAANYGSARPGISNAKPPIKPVGGGRSSPSKSADDLPFGPEWIRKENQRDRERKKSGSYF